MASLDKKAVCVVALAAIIVAVYFATSNTPGSALDTPQYQKESQLGGIAVSPKKAMNYGTPLSMAPELHFWAPGFTETGYLSENHPFITTKHRYPSVSGGNLSTVMHYGWSRFQLAPPANDEWFRNPPEVAVL